MIMRNLRKRLMECKILVYFFTVIFKYDCFAKTLRQNLFVASQRLSHADKECLLVLSCPSVRLHGSQWTDLLHVLDRELLRKESVTKIRISLKTDKNTYEALYTQT
jgi:hypothetical protein